MRPALARLIPGTNRSRSLLTASLGFALLALSACSERAVERETILAPRAEEPVGTTITPDNYVAPMPDILLQLSPGVDISTLWTDLDLIPMAVMDDGITFKARPAIPGRTAGDEVLRLQSDDRLDYVEEDVPVSVPTLRQSSMSFNEGSLVPGQFHDQMVSERLRLQSAHNVARGFGSVVAILDTGIDLHHPMLLGHVRADGYDFVDRDTDPGDVGNQVDDDGDGYPDRALGHGSHVAGLVSLVAPAASLLPIRVLNDEGSGTAWDVANGIYYAVNHGATIINLSLRLSVPSAAVNRAIGYADENGVIVVCAAGNTGSYGELDYPASDPRVIAVASVDAMDRRSSFSSWSTQIALAAPGENLLSTYWNDGYAVWSGTSAAAPIVSGTLALLNAPKVGLKGDEARQRLLDTATPLRGESFGMGAGVVSPWRAVGSPTEAEPINVQSDALLSHDMR